VSALAVVLAAGNLSVALTARALAHFTPPAVVALAAGLVAVVVTLAGLLP
jgi:hypothetical protein